MKKKIIAIILIIVSIIGVIIFFINRKNSEENVNIKGKFEQKINPLSKKYAINILKAEYGDFISVTENDITMKGDEYIIDVYVSMPDEEGREDSGEHEHEQSLGLHKINVFTGELIISDENTENK